MATRFLIALLASLAIGAQAGPIVFTSPSYSANAIAIADGPAGISLNGPSSTPIQGTAFAGINDFATAFALTTVGLLDVFAEADSFAGSTFATAESHFIGSFAGDGPLKLHLNFSDLSSALGGGSGDATLSVILTNSLAGSLFTGSFTSGGLINLPTFVVPVGGISTLELDLNNEAFGNTAGDSGQNSSQVTFGGTIPLPATPLLVFAGLAAMRVARRKRENGAAA